MDIRGARLRKPRDEALAFTSSMASDGRIAGHIIEVNMAHMLALAASGEVDRPTASKCIRYLLGPPAINPGSMAEDFHQQLEQDAVDSIGVEAAGSLNYGKSRNDQVATSIRMELRLRVLELIDSIALLQEAALRLAARHGTSLLPGYTHLQRAQPVTLAHHLFAYFDSLQRDVDRLLGLYSRVNLSPMGSAALAGTEVRVDRRQVAKALGFSGIVRNSMDAVSSRDIAAEAISDAATTMLDAARVAEELILWSSAEFGYVELDDAYSASSSIMPQKKNAVVAEIARAKSGSVLGDMTAVYAILKALPYSYNLDLQEATPHIWRAFDDATSSLQMLAGALSTLRVNTKAMSRSLPEDGSTAVALANYLVRVKGLSFREAHSAVGGLVRSSIEKGTPLYMAASKASRKDARVDQETAKLLLDPQHFLNSISTEGGSNPKFIPRGLADRRKDLGGTRRTSRVLASALKRSQRSLHRTASGLAREVKSSS